MAKLAIGSASLATFHESRTNGLVLVATPVILSIHLESSALSGTSLLLDWHDLEHFILQDFVRQEEVNDLKLLHTTNRAV